MSTSRGWKGEVFLSEALWTRERDRTYLEGVGTSLAFAQLHDRTQRTQALSRRALPGRALSIISTGPAPA